MSQNLLSRFLRSLDAFQCFQGEYKRAVFSPRKFLTSRLEIGRGLLSTLLLLSILQYSKIT
jgi:hypothetical protein